jgi:hypothetical protein
MAEGSRIWMKNTPPEVRVNTSGGVAQRLTNPSSQNREARHRDSESLENGEKKGTCHDREITTLTGGVVRRTGRDGVDGKNLEVQVQIAKPYQPYH